MLDTLRKINWPEGVQPAGAIIPAALLAQVADYDGLIMQAEKKAEEVLSKAEIEIAEKSEKVRREVSNAVHSDFEKLKKLLVGQRNKILQQSSSVCVEVAKIAVGNFIESLDEQRKISSLVGLLIKKLHSKSNIVFIVNPSQIETLQEVLEKGFDRVLKKGDFQIKEDNTLELDQIRVSSVEDAFIDISLKNLVGMLCGEVEQLQEHFDQEIRGALEIDTSLPEMLNQETIE